MVIFDSLKPAKLKAEQHHYMRSSEHRLVLNIRELGPYSLRYSHQKLDYLSVGKDARHVPHLLDIRTTISRPLLRSSDPDS